VRKNSRECETVRRYVKSQDLFRNDRRRQKGKGLISSGVRKGGEGCRTGGVVCRARWRKEGGSLIGGKQLRGRKSQGLKKGEHEGKIPGGKLLRGAPERKRIKSRELVQAGEREQ